MGPAADVDLYPNQLTESSAGFGQPVALQTLDLYQHQLTELSDNFDQLVALQMWTSIRTSARSCLRASVSL